MTSSPIPTPTLLKIINSVPETFTPFPIDSLVLYNPNYLPAEELADYYLSKRGLPPQNKCAVHWPVSLFANPAQLKSAMTEILTNCICPNLKETVSPCNETNIAEIKEKNTVQTLVLIKGIPSRLSDTTWTLPWDALLQPIDYLLSFGLLSPNAHCSNAGCLFDPAGNGNTGLNLSGDYSNVLSTEYLENLNYDIPLPLLHKRGVFAVGRIEGITKESAKNLIDRTMIAEEQGLSGNFITNDIISSGSPGGQNSSNAYNYLAELTSDLITSSLNHYRHANPVDWNLSRVGFQPNAVPGGRAEVPTVFNIIGAFLSDYLSGHPLGDHQAHWPFFNEPDPEYSWKTSLQNCPVLCKDSSNPTLCRENSKDYFKEFNTNGCFGTSSGAVGFQLRSYPVGHFGLYPVNWYTDSAGGPNTYTPPIYKFSGGFTNSFFTDENYLQFGEDDTANLNGEIPLFLASKLITAVAEPLVVNSQYQFRFKFKYQASTPTNYPLSASISAFKHPWGATGSVATQTYILNISGNTNDWTEYSVDFSVPANSTDTLNGFAFVFESKRSDHPKGILKLDAIEVICLNSNLSLLSSSFGGFHQLNVSNYAAGAWPAEAMERMGFVGWMGSSNHFMTGGFAFSKIERFTKSFYGYGLPMGHAWLYDGNSASGLRYGDPLYRPMSVSFFSHFTEEPIRALKGISSSAAYYTESQYDVSENSSRYQFMNDGITPHIPIFINAINGSKRKLDTRWDVSICRGISRLEDCVQSNNWVSLFEGNEAAEGYRLPLGENGLLSLVENPANPLLFFLRLKVYRVGESTPYYAFSRFSYLPVNPTLNTLVTSVTAFGSSWVSNGFVALPTLSIINNTTNTIQYFGIDQIKVIKKFPKLGGIPTLQLLSRTGREYTMTFNESASNFNSSGTLVYNISPAINTPDRFRMKISFPVGNYDFTFKVLPYDADRDGYLTSSDENMINQGIISQAYVDQNPSEYSILNILQIMRTDLNNSGRVDTNDLLNYQNLVNQGLITLPDNNW